MSKSFQDCIMANVQKGLLDQSDAENLVKEHEFLLEKNSDAEAVSRLERQILDRQVKQKANFLRHMKRREEFFAKMDQFKTTGEKLEFVSHQLQAARDKGAVTYETTLHVFNDSMKDVNSGKISEQTFKDAVIHVIDGTTSKDPQTQALVQSIRNTFRYLKNEADIHGLMFGDLGERYFPRYYDKVQFRKMTEDQFFNAVSEHLNLSGMSDAEAREMVKTFKLDVETDGLYSQTLPSNIEQAFDATGEKNFALKRNKTRQLTFKSGADYAEFVKKMGGGDGAFVEHLHKYMMSISNDLGVMKQLGSMPKSLIDEAIAKLNAEHGVSKSAGGEGGAIKKATKGLVTAKNTANLRSIKSEFEVLMGSAFTGDRDGHIYKAFVATQNWMRACQLGSATISALSDPSFGVIAQKMNGGSFIQPIKDYLGLFGGLVGHKSVAKQIAKEVGYSVEGFNGMMIGDTRFTLGGEGKGIAKRMADLTFKLSGLDAWTKNGKIIAKVNANNTIAHMVENKIGFLDLPEGLKKTLETIGVKENDWADILTHLEVREFKGGRTFVEPNQLRVSKELGYARGSDLADMIDSFTEQVKNLAINEGNLKTDALTSGAILSGEGKASAGGKMLASALLQYKSFAINILYNHLIPAMKRAAEIRGARDINKLDHLAMLMIGTTVAAAIPLQLKAMLKGKTPMDMTTGEFWLASTLQGGGMGILGDFLFKDTSRAGNTLAETIAGPYVGALSNAWQVASGAVMDANADDANEKKAMKRNERRAREGWRVLKSNIPLNNLWYTRLMTERLIFDNIERVADPSFDKRMNRLEKRLTKEGDGKAPYWWAPGRAPEPETIVATKTARR